MPIALFEFLCVVVVLATLLAMSRRRPARVLVPEYLALVAAGWIGEQTCIAAYRYYAYAPSWHLRVVDVPVLVPLIWPLVILSAGEVVTALFPGAGRWRPVLVGLVVAVDASLVEVLAVRAGLWSWAEGGHLGVPFVGIFGWGCFATAATVLLARAGTARLPLVVAGAPLCAHALILVGWWGLFRWGARTDVGAGATVVVLLTGAILAAAAWWLAHRGRVLGLGVAGSRMLAATLFVALLVATDAGNLPLWAHTWAVAVPYLVVTRLRR